jgi:glycosyltransferase involved in cell wall biosynthesis
MPTTSSVPRVSIITPSYNHGQFLERTLLSVLHQDYENLEYIVVDGQSTDKTQQILAKYQTYIDIVLVEPDNGQADALNKGFKLCTGEMIAYLNSDDCYANATVISQVVQQFQAHPEADVIYGQRYWIDAEGKLRRTDPYRPFSAADFYLSDFIPQECTFWRRSLFERVGPYVDSGYEFAMDYELFLRFLQAGATLLAVPHHFGLFRDYPDQKSAFLWKNKGLSEIARLQQTYLGRTLNEAGMMACNQRFFYGVDPETEPDLFRFYQQYWYAVNIHQQKVLHQRSLDQWVYGQGDRAPDMLSRRALRKVNRQIAK